MINKRSFVDYRFQTSPSRPHGGVCFQISKGVWARVMNPEYHISHIIAKWAGKEGLAAVEWVQFVEGPKEMRGSKKTSWEVAHRGVGVYAAGSRWATVDVKIIGEPAVKKVKVIWGLCYDKNGNPLPDCIEHLVELEKN